MGRDLLEITNSPFQRLTQHQPHGLAFDTFPVLDSGGSVLSCNCIIASLALGLTFSHLFEGAF